MKFSIIDLFAPHYCCSCGAIGAILCDYCKNDIICEPYSGCLACGRLAAPQTGLCSSCPVPFGRAWCAGERTGALKELINRYKFERARAAKTVIVDLLDAALPQLPKDTAIVPVPTIAPHIRQRGYDHMALVARGLARRRQLPYHPIVERASNAVQHGATRKVRLAQARLAFSCRPVPAGSYLLIDDIYTTGATLRFAARALLDAGATEVWAAVVARQPLSAKV